MTTISISYLGCGPVAAPPPTTVQLEHKLPVAVHAGYGDRSEPDGRIPIYTSEDGDGVYVLLDDSGLRAAQRDRTGQCAVPVPDWAAALPEIRELVIAALLGDSASRPEVAAARAAYAAIVERDRREDLAQRREWAQDVARIATAFGRPVVVGEQTVPGRCVVRSPDGDLLGYADVRDGRWTGTIQEVAKGGGR